MLLFIGIHSLIFLDKYSKNEIEEKESDESDGKETKKLQVEIVAVNRSRLSNKDIIEIRRLAALMGNPTEPESDEEVSNSDGEQYDDVPDDLLFDVVESSC